jgi:hypothetical protein
LEEGKKERKKERKKKKTKCGRRRRRRRRRRRECSCNVTRMATSTRFFFESKTVIIRGEKCGGNYLCFSLEIFFVCIIT